MSLISKRVATIESRLKPRKTQQIRFVRNQIELDAAYAERAAGGDVKIIEILDCRTHKFFEHDGEVL